MIRAFIFRILLYLDKIIKREKGRILKNKLMYCGPNVRIDSTCSILGPKKLEIGENTSISSFTTIYAAFGVKIGNNCLISSNCGISSYNHIINSSNRKLEKHRDKEFSKMVVIGNNVWIGMNVCILPGVSIGDNSIIGSGSVVTKNIPENEIWVGNPARFLKKVII